MSIDQMALALLLTLNIQWGNPVDDRELMCMAHAVYHESATDTLAGKVAVANSIVNRVEQRQFPNSICGVVKQRMQFSYLNSGNRDHLAISNHIDYNAWERSLIVSLTVAGGYVEDITGGANHYLNKSIVPRIPNWYNVAEKKGKFGYHHFAKLEW